MTPPYETATGRAYIDYCRRRLTQEYLPRIGTCLDALSEEDVWWRAHETDNSIGNLLLHLSGNMRQWIIGGLGEGQGVRDRAAEFSERRIIPKKELFALFSSTVHEAAGVLATFDPSKLMEVRRIQVYDVTCLDAISHVVEHVAQHMGQIIYITKLRKGIDLQFFRL